MNKAPYSPELEEALLGSILINPSITLSLDLVSEEFYIHRHRFIFDAILALVENARDVDVLTLSEELERAGKLNEVGGYPFLAKLITEVPTSLHAETYVKQLKQLAGRRRMIQIANELAQAALDTETEVEISAASALDQLSNFKVSQGGARSITEHHFRVKGELIRRSEVSEDAFSLRTGFADIDRLLGRMYPDDGTLLLIVGDPGQGKTVLMQDMARFYALQAPGAIYSSEMTAFRLMLRDYSARDGLKVSDMKRGQVDLEELDKLDRHYQKTDLFLSDSSEWTTTALRADLTRLKREHGVRWYTFDYLSLLKDEVRGEEHDRTRQISLRLMRINRALGMHALIVHTLTKSGAVAGSAGVGYDADIIAQLKATNSGISTGTYQPVDFIVSKNRDGEGPLGSATLGLMFDRPHFITPGMKEEPAPWYNKN